MTRFLSEALQAPEPFFRLGLKRLEAAGGQPNTDIRFSMEVQAGVKAKLLQLGLDPKDTTPQELYHVLQARVKADDARLTKTLRTLAANNVSAEADVVAGMAQALKALPDSKVCFAVKSSSLRAMLKKTPPKKAMKQLGYRSLDSFLKHETGLSVMAAAWLSEGATWQRRLIEQYKKLQPGDFESRTIQVIYLNSKRWQALSETIVAQKRHNLLSFKELGGLVLLPLPASVPPGAVTASLSLALHELNEIRAASTFLKLSQVRPDFGEIVRKLVTEEPRLNSQLFDEPVPWHLIQRYYARLKHELYEDLFEPYIQKEDMSWHSVEAALSRIEPTFKFWQHTEHLAVLHNRRPVSLNLLDTALNVCNEVSFERRLTDYFKRTLWHELLLRYMHHEPVQRSVLAELQPQLAVESVEA
jgi:hypothetical protein